MGQIGEELERARKLKGLTLREVEEATKIRIKYLGALEEEDFKVIPGRVYVIGFLRTYAKFLGLDDELLVSQFKEQLDVRPPAEEKSENRPAAEQRTHVEHRTSGKKGRTGSFILILLVIGLVVAGVYYFGIRNASPKQPPDTSSAAQNPAADNSEQGTNPAPQTTEPAESPKTAPEASGVSVAVEIKADDCWLDVTIDGKDNFRGTLSAGDSRTFSGSGNVRIKFGNAGVASVTYQGETVYPIGGVGQVVTKEYSANQ